VLLWFVLLCVQEHYRMGVALAPLRSQGVLLLASGMSFHNMGQFSRDAGSRATVGQVSGYVQECSAGWLGSCKLSWVHIWVGLRAGSATAHAELLPHIYGGGIALGDAFNAERFSLYSMARFNLTLRPC
jgi:hypothetical protein